MASDKRAFLFIFWSLLAACTFPVNSEIMNVRNYYIEDVCRGVSSAVLDLSRSGTGYLLFFDEPEPLSCDVLLMPESGSSVILSFYMHVPDPNDQIIIEDSDGLAVSLEGSWLFADGQKSLLSEGKMTLRYSINTSSPINRRRIKYRFLFTQARGGPCRSDEFQCLNGKCIPHHLKCDGHNHCGDDGYHQECTNGGGFHYATFSPVIQSRSSISILLVSLVASLFTVGIIVTVIVLLVRRQKKKEAAPTPTAPPAEEAPPSAFARFRQSFRSSKRFSAPVAATPGPKVYQVPSMYPQIPEHSQEAAPDLPGAENSELKAEV